MRWSLVTLAGCAVAMGCSDAEPASVIASIGMKPLPGVAKFWTEPSASPHQNAISVAGPVVDGRSTTTNLPWQVDERALEVAVPVARARLLNDLEATAHGVFVLSEDQLVPLQPGRPQRGTLAVIAAGTGLGVALVVGDAARRTVIASEGGHADFAPRDELEDDHAALGETPQRGFARVEEESLPEEEHLPDEVPLEDDGLDDEELEDDDGHPDEDADVLEDTPDFLQETPEHDRLWFEQKPPRDFDFD